MPNFSPIPLCRTLSHLLLTGRPPFPGGGNSNGRRDRIAAVAVILALASAVALAGAILLIGLTGTPTASASTISITALGMGSSAADGGGGNTEYVTGDEITITATFSQFVTWTGGAPRLPITLGSKTVDFEAASSNSSPTKIVDFTYTVLHSDQAPSGPSIAASATLNLNSATFTHQDDAPSPTPGQVAHTATSTALPDQFTQSAATLSAQHKVNPHCASVSGAITAGYTTTSEAGKTNLSDAQMNALVADCRALVLARTSLSRVGNIDGRRMNWFATTRPADDPDDPGGAPDSFATWWGVDRNSNHRVTRVYLNYAGVNPEWQGFVSPHYADLSELQEISFPGQYFQGAVPGALGGLSNLQTINLRLNPITSVGAGLGDSRSLQTLNLSMTNLGLSSDPTPLPAALGSISSLQTLDLSYTQLTDSIPTWLGDLTNLRTLRLNNHPNFNSTGFTGSIPTQLGSLTNLQTLRLDRNSLTGSIPPELGSLTSLTDLRLDRNDLTGNIPTQLGSLTSLERLYLRENDLDGSIPTQLGSMTALKLLIANDNDLTGNIPTQLGNLTNLEHLWLHNNDLNGSIPEKLGELTTNLRSMKLQNNELSGAIPAKLKDLGANLRGWTGYGSFYQLDMTGNRLESPITLSGLPTEMKESEGEQTFPVQASLDAGTIWAADYDPSNPKGAAARNVRIIVQGSGASDAAEFTATVSPETFSFPQADADGNSVFSVDLTITPVNSPPSGNETITVTVSGEGAPGIANTALRASQTITIPLENDVVYVPPTPVPTPTPTPSPYPRH